MGLGGVAGMTTITQFLLARIAEDEAVARAASLGPWHVNPESDEVLAVDDITVCDAFALSGPQLRATTAHIARHDPARVLAEGAAKRAVVWLYNSESEYERGDYGQGVEDALLRLATPYAEHPDYDAEWSAK